MLDDQRWNEISPWLQSLDLNLVKLRHESLAGDASSRKYYRLSVEGAKYVLMDAGMGGEIAPFINLAVELQQAKIITPKIYHYNLKQGLVLMQDLGSKLYSECLNIETADELYRSAIDSLLLMQTSLELKNLQLTAMDTSYLLDKIRVFQEWFLEAHLGVKDSISLKHQCQEIFNIFRAAFFAMPQVFVHLDYHSRNLLVLEDNNRLPGVIDFQDAMLGPAIYDVVSLLQDAYIVWEQDKINVWLHYYYTEAQNRGILPTMTFSELRRLFVIIGLQRHLKNLGVFCRLKIRDNKPGYMCYLDNLQNYITVACQSYPELNPIAALFAELVVPEVAKRRSVI